MCVGADNTHALGDLHLVCTRVHRGRITTVFSRGQEPLSILRESDEIVVYQLPAASGDGNIAMDAVSKVTHVGDEMTRDMEGKIQIQLVQVVSNVWSVPLLVRLPKSAQIREGYCLHALRAIALRRCPAKYHASAQVVVVDHVGTRLSISGGDTLDGHGNKNYATVPANFFHRGGEISVTWESDAVVWQLQKTIDHPSCLADRLRHCKMEGCTLDDLMNTFVGEEEVRKDCSLCGSSRASRRIHLERIPRVLAIRIRRISYAGKRRHRSKAEVAIPTATWKIPYFAENNPTHQKQCVYRLRSFIRHLGDSFGGHFVATCRTDSTDTWSIFDDERCSEDGEFGQRDSHRCSDTVMLFLEAEKITANGDSCITLHNFSCDEPCRFPGDDPSQKSPPGSELRQDRHEISSTCPSSDKSYVNTPPAEELRSLESKKVERLVDMGFDRQKAEDALLHTRGIVEDAISLLMEGKPASHAVQQLMDMGFSNARASRALAASGYDLQTALQMLL